MFLAGAANGQVEILRNHYPTFAVHYPNANPDYWNPQESWRNKWRNGDPAQGERYFGSSTFLAWNTDAYHLFRTIEKTAITGAVIIPLHGRKKWWVYPLEFAGAGLVWSAGFHTVYSLKYRRN